MSAAPAATYAQALIESTGAAASTVADELDAFAAIERDAPEQWNALVAPGVPNAARKAVVDQMLAEGNVLTRNTLKVLIDHGRLAELGEVAAEFRAIVEARGGHLDVHVTSAIELPAELAKTVEETLSASTGKQVTLHTSIDPEIIGGLVVQYGDTLVDTSLKGRLEQLRLALSKPTPRASTTDAD